MPLPTLPPLALEYPLFRFGLDAQTVGQHRGSLPVASTAAWRTSSPTVAQHTSEIRTSSRSLDALWTPRNDSSRCRPSPPATPRACSRKEEAYLPENTQPTTQP